MLKFRRNIIIVLTGCCIKGVLISPWLCKALIMTVTVLFHTQYYSVSIRVNVPLITSVTIIMYTVLAPPMLITSS